MGEIADADVEAVARAICAYEGRDPDTVYPPIHDERPILRWEYYAGEARAALAEVLPPRDAKIAELQAEIDAALEGVQGLAQARDEVMRKLAEIEPLIAGVIADRDRLAAELEEMKAAQPDMYWIADDPESSCEDPSEFIANDAISVLPGETVKFTTAYHGPDETWTAVAVTGDGELCPKCGGRTLCEDWLGEDCPAQEAELRNLAAHPADVSETEGKS